LTLKIHNMKTYVVTVSKFFPGFHPKKGEETGFVEKILSGEKIHTIRGNLELWEKRIAEVQEGKAVLSLRYWSGKPYRSPQVEFKQLTSVDGVGIQEIEFYREICTNTLVDYFSENYSKIAQNDGLGRGDYVDWFASGKYDLSKPMAIIQFTKFRY
jgi:hypothetical protein